MTVSNETAFDFDFDKNPQPIERSMRYKGEEYELREASTSQAMSWRNSVLRCLAPSADGNMVPTEGMPDNEPLLVSLCLFNKSNNKPVPLATIKTWPHRVTKPLFLEARRISRLEGDQEEDTVESVTKKITVLQKRLDELTRASEANEEPSTEAKN